MAEPSLLEAWDAFRAIWSPILRFQSAYECLCCDSRTSLDAGVAYHRASCVFMAVEKAAERERVMAKPVDVVTNAKVQQDLSFVCHALWGMSDRLGNGDKKELRIYARMLADAYNHLNPAHPIRLSNNDSDIVEVPEIHIYNELLIAARRIRQHWRVHDGFEASSLEALCTALDSIDAWERRDV